MDFCEVGVKVKYIKSSSTSYHKRQKERRKGKKRQQATKQWPGEAMN